MTSLISYFLEESTESLSDFETALIIAIIAHSGQTRRNDEEYIHHVIRVAERCSKENRVAAILHDVIEDTGLSAQSLLDFGISQENIDLVLILTHGTNEPYLDYITRVKESPRATAIKVIDILDNLSSDPSPRQIEKYNMALKILNP